MLTEEQIISIKNKYGYIRETGQLCNKITGRVYKGASASGGRYRQVKVDDLVIYVHKIVWMMHNNWTEPEGVIDHINRNSLDNRIENLMVVSHTENMINASKYGKWIRFANNKYRVEFVFKGIIQYKSFTTLEEAILYRANVEENIKLGVYKLKQPERSQLPVGIYKKYSKTQVLPYLVSDGVKEDKSFLTLEEAIEYLNK